ncbi:tryptophan synthase subunit alpha [Synechococcus sp. W2B2]|uniref:tryptophan synthase subunit alpha n=1 Tax=Synechococcus sp. W2B2 TaxID=3392296 RepID=UPI0039EC347F
MLSLKECDAGPVAVGFGISGADQVRQVREWGADGAIIGKCPRQKNRPLHNWLCSGECW